MPVASLGGLASALWLGCLRPGAWWLAVCGTAGLAAAAADARRRPRRAWLVAVLALVLVGAGLAGGRLALAERGALTDLAERGGLADLQATVVTEARETAHGAWLLVRVAAVDGAPARQRALLRLDEGMEAPALGTRLELRAAAEPLGDEGFHGHLRRLGAVAGLTTVTSSRIVGSPTAPIAASTRMRERARAAFEARLSAAHAALLSGLTTGDLRGRPDGQREQFSAAGLSHLVVVSGKHTALMLAGVIGICAVLGVGARGRRYAGLVALAWFVVLVRWQPSVLRAGGMAALVLVAGLLGRARLGGRLLWAAVLLLLLGEPLLAARLGFILSVLATAGVLLVGPRLVDRLRGPMWLRWTAAATVGAQLGVAPVLMATDGAVPPGALPANLVAGPAAAAAQAIGLVSGAVAQASPATGGALAGLAGPFLAAILWSADTFAGLPTIEARHALSPAAGALLVAVLAWRRRALCAGALATAVVLAVVPAWRGPPDVGGLTVTALDVGQGDAILVEAPTAAPGEGTARMLYDGGPDERVILRRLRERRVDRLDAVVLSHGHYDHAAGLVAVLSTLDVGALVIGARPGRAGDPPSDIAGAVARAAADHRVPVHRVRAGDRFPLGGALVTVLNPPASTLAGGDLNENSVVLRIQGRHGSVLLTGDAEVEAQRRLLRRPGRIAVDVLQVPHHGAATNAGGFVARTGARVALISVGADNDYGHPHPGVLADLAGMEVLRTDAHGTVGVALGPDGPVARRRSPPARGDRRLRDPARPRRWDRGGRVGGCYRLAHGQRRRPHGPRAGGGARGS